MLAGLVEVGEKITTFVNIRMVGSVSTVAKTKYYFNSQLLSRLHQVLDTRQRIVDERAGNKDGDGLNAWAFDPRIEICTTNVARPRQVATKPDDSKRAKIVYLLRHRSLCLDTRHLFPGQQLWLAVRSVGSLTPPTVWLPHLRPKPNPSRLNLQSDLQRWFPARTPKLHPYD